MVPNTETLRLGNRPPGYNLSMRITRGKVIDGRIVVEGEPLDEGSILTILVSDEPAFTLTEEEEKMLLESIAQADRGELLDAKDVLNRLP